jgi:5-methylcytosine-specific restriction endonuclease McrA
MIFERGLDLLLTELERTKLAAAKRQRASGAAIPASRYIPADIKRAVWQRDGGRCGFEGTQGRCTETGFLEYHHVVPFADGGETSASNLELRCRAHNQHEASLWFGESQTPNVREERAPFLS